LNRTLKNILCHFSVPHLSFKSGMNCAWIVSVYHFHGKII
jgi:hypothetical protein